MLRRFRKWLKGKLVREVRIERNTPVFVPVLASDLLKGRRALITGGSSGIGFAIADAGASIASFSTTLTSGHLTRSWTPAARSTSL